MKFGWNLIENNRRDEWIFLFILTSYRITLIYILLVISLCWQMSRKSSISGKSFIDFIAFHTPITFAHMEMVFESETY